MYVIDYEKKLNPKKSDLAPKGYHIQFNHRGIYHKRIESFTDDELDESIRFFLKFKDRNYYANQKLIELVDEYFSRK